MHRKPGWEKRLFATVREWDAKPFKWGSADCVAFVLAVGHAVRGKPLCPPLAKYGDALGANRVLRNMGADSLEDAIAMHLDPVPVALAQRGDMGVVVNNGNQCAVVNTGLHWVGRTEHGIIRVSRETLIRAFKV